MKFHYMAHDNQSKSMKQLWPGKLCSFNWKRKMEETNWSSDFYSDIFSLDFDSLFNTIDLESLASKENSDTVPEVLNTTNWESEPAVLVETINKLPAPDESRFPRTSTDQIQETIKEAQNKNMLRITSTWMTVWYSWASHVKSQEYRNNGARNFRRSPPKILSGSEKARRLRVWTGLT